MRNQNTASMLAHMRFQSARLSCDHQRAPWLMRQLARWTRGGCGGSSSGAGERRPIQSSDCGVDSCGDVSGCSSYIANTQTPLAHQGAQRWRPSEAEAHCGSTVSVGVSSDAIKWRVTRRPYESLSEQTECSSTVHGATTVSPPDRNRIGRLAQCSTALCRGLWSGQQK